MSTPSLDAKQTTEGWPDWIRLEDCRQAIDAATAKLREECAAKQRENFELAQRLDAANRKIEGFEHDVRLAHQQSSAPTPDMEKWTAEEVKAMLDEWGKFTHLPASEYQRIADEHNADLVQAREPLVRDKERLDWLEAHTYHGKPSKSKWGNGKAVHQIEDIWTQPGLNLREAIDAALTGTGNHRKHQRG